MRAGVWRRSAAAGARAGSARSATRVGGLDLPAGALVTLCIGAANRDPAVYDGPETLNLRREGNKHLAFGQGLALRKGARRPVEIADAGCAGQGAAEGFLQHGRGGADDADAGGHVHAEHDPQQPELRGLVRVVEVDMLR